jgi:hypothetical protein
VLQISINFDDLEFVKGLCERRSVVCGSTQSKQPIYERLREAMRCQNDDLITESQEGTVKDLLDVAWIIRQARNVGTLGKPAESPRTECCESGPLA